MVIKEKFKSRFVFDIRGLMAERVLTQGTGIEGVKVKLTKAVERRSRCRGWGCHFDRKDLTVIKDWDGLRGRKVVHEVVPCCADLRLFCHSASERSKRRGTWIG